MKKVIRLTFLVLACWAAFEILYYYTGILYIPHMGESSYIGKVEEGQLYMKEGEEFEVFSIRGVNMGLGKPGYYATETAITKEEYLRWFKQIQDMGANVLRVYTIGSPNFYKAFYEYNIENETPLYLLHGVWVDDYLINATYAAMDKEFYEPFLADCKDVVDVVHGRYKKVGDDLLKPGTYNKDISPWVYGYIVGIEWETTLVTYTEKVYVPVEQYDGKYLYTEDASDFEIFLANIGDQMIAYEDEKYGTQKVLAFSNWATTDPFAHDEKVKEYFQKAASVDVEHIKCKDTFHTGQFASYHVYPYYPDYYSFLEEHEENTYLQYLTDLNKHHTMPVVITEFGVPSSRGIAAVEESYGRNQGGMSETEQGEALISLYEDIMASGSNGGIVFTWQDEWFKRTWNTMTNINLDATPYWSDYQTNEQYFGLLSFDPGKEKSICYVDGDKTDWAEEELVGEQEGIRLSMKYDEKFMYFMVEKEGWNILRDALFIPVDVTPKSGSKKAENLAITMSEAADFVIEINGKNESRVWVQEYYDTIEALFYDEISPYNIFSQKFPSKDTTNFQKIYMLLQKDICYNMIELGAPDINYDQIIPYSEFDIRNPFHYQTMATYETGHLTYGNANPSAPEFNSLADFCAGEGFVEIKIPWQLLNFADPSQMYIHDDYFEVLGVEYLRINHIKVGAGTGESEIQMKEFALNPLGRHPKYHERLKKSYYILRDYWTANS